MEIKNNSNTQLDENPDKIFCLSLGQPEAADLLKSDNNLNFDSFQKRVIDARIYSQCCFESDKEEKELFIQDSFRLFQEVNSQIGHGLVYFVELFLCVFFSINVLDYLPWQKLTRVGLVGITRLQVWYQLRF